MFAASGAKVIFNARIKLLAFQSKIDNIISSLHQNAHLVPNAVEYFMRIFDKHIANEQNKQNALYSPIHCCFCSVSLETGPFNVKYIPLQSRALLKSYNIL